MTLEEVTLDELLGKLKSGHIGNINDYYRKVFIDFLEELKTLRVELEKNSKELEVYKKAFKLLCEYLDDSGICAGCGLSCPPDGKIPCSDIIYETCLHKAREALSNV